MTVVLGAVQAPEADPVAPAELLLGAERAPVVIVVAASRAEQAALVQAQRHERPVLVAATMEQAMELLARLAGEPTEPVRVCADRRVAQFGDTEVPLTPLEHELLSALVSSPGRVWSFEALAGQVWNTHYVGDTSQVRATVKRLRRKLLAASAPVRIEAERGVGFRLVEGRLSLLPHNCP